MVFAGVWIIGHMEGVFVRNLLKTTLKTHCHFFSEEHAEELVIILSRCSRLLVPCPPVRAGFAGTRGRTKKVKDLKKHAIHVLDASNWYVCINMFLQRYIGNNAMVDKRDASDL